MSTFKVRSSALWLAAISLIYWFCAGLRAAYRPFWYDELLTWHLARLPSVAAIWATLQTGADNQMPLTSVSVYYSQLVFGAGLLATRLPALVGFWVMLLGIYVFLRRRLPLPYALIGMMFPMLTFAWSYAFEARGYGLLLGGVALALVSWQAAAEGNRRPLALVGIAAGLAVALGSVAVALVLAVPFALGEAVRTFERRRLDLPVWIAFGAAGLVALLYPAVAAGTRDWHLEALRPSLTQISDVYATFLKSSVTPLLIAGGAAYVLITLDSNKKADPGAGSALPRHEAAAMLALAATPAILLVIGLFSSHFFFFTRHAMSCVIALAVWIAILACRCAGGRPRAGWLMLLVMMAWLTAARAREAVALAHDPTSEFRNQYALLAGAAADGRPVVVSAAQSLLAADFYLPADAAARLYYVVDHESARAYAGQDLSDKNVTAVSHSFQLRAHVLPWTDFAAARRSFLWYKTTDGFGICDVLLRSGWHVSLKALGEEQEALYEVTPPTG